MRHARTPTIRQAREPNGVFKSVVIALSLRSDPRISNLVGPEPAEQSPADRTGRVKSPPGRGDWEAGPHLSLFPLLPLPRRPGQHCRVEPDRRQVVVRLVSRRFEVLEEPKHPDEAVDREAGGGDTDEDAGPEVERGRDPVEEISQAGPERDQAEIDRQVDEKQESRDFSLITNIRAVVPGRFALEMIGPASRRIRVPTGLNTGDAARAMTGPSGPPATRRCWRG